MLRVRLSEHRELHIGGVAGDASVVGKKIVDFIRSECKPQSGVGVLQRRASPRQYTHDRERLRLVGPEHRTPPRARRRTASRPQRRAMSLAFDDHGEMVPRRGTLSSMRPPPAGAGSPYRSRRSSTAASRGSSVRSASTKGQYSAAAIRTDPWDVARRELSLSSRKAETAQLPRSLRINDMSRAGKVQLYPTPHP